MEAAESIASWANFPQQWGDTALPVLPEEVQVFPLARERTPEAPVLSDQPSPARPALQLSGSSLQALNPARGHQAGLMRWRFPLARLGLCPGCPGHGVQVAGLLLSSSLCLSKCAVCTRPRGSSYVLIGGKKKVSQHRPTRLAEELSQRMNLLFFLGC